MTYMFKALQTLTNYTPCMVEEEDYDNIIWLEEPPENPPTIAQLQAKAAELQTAADWADLRKVRTEKLQETDYFGMPDVTMSDEMRAYRQALRDLPANTTDPANPIWPTKP